MKDFKNSAEVYGRVYQHDLKLRVVEKEGPNKGQEYITGTLHIAMDDACTDTVPVRYSYVTPTFKSGKTNSTFTALKKIIVENCTVVMAGKDNAPMVKITNAALEPVDFFNQEGELITGKRISGGFIDFTSNFPESFSPFGGNQILIETLVTGIVEVEANEEKNIPAFYRVKGYGFNFRKEIFPVEFPLDIPQEDGPVKDALTNLVDNFDGTPSEPRMVLLRASLSNKKVKVSEKVEMDFGESVVEEREYTEKRWSLTGFKALDTEFDDETTITVEEVKSALANREVKLAEEKKRTEEWRAEQGKTKGEASKQEKNKDFSF